MNMSKEQVEILKNCGEDCDCNGCAFENGLDCVITPIQVNAVISFLQAEADRKELAHEKARRAVEVELKKTHDNMLGNLNVSVKAISQQAERIIQLEKALNKASQLLQDNGFEEESKAIDCMAEL